MIEKKVKIDGKVLGYVFLEFHDHNTYEYVIGIYLDGIIPFDENMAFEEMDDLGDEISDSWNTAAVFDQEKSPFHSACIYTGDNQFVFECVIKNLIKLKHDEDERESPIVKHTVQKLHLYIKELKEQGLIY